MMDEILKKRFSNFKPEVPEDLTQKIFDQIGVERVPAPKPNPISKILILAGVSISLVFSFGLLYEADDPATENTILTETSVHSDLFGEINKAKDTPITQNEAINIAKNEPAKISSKTREVYSETKKEVLGEKISKLREETKIAESKKGKEINRDNKESETSSVSKSEISHFEIAPCSRKVCNSSCILTVNSSIKGEWTADQEVVFEKISEQQTLVKYTQKGAVLFRFSDGEKTDTFTVFFNQKLADINFEIQANACQTAHQVIFNIPEEREISALEYHLINKRIEDLSAGQHLIKLKDNLKCQYIINVEVPEIQSNTPIQVEALRQEIGYPIYFQTHKSSEETEFYWDFGDGTYSTEPKPEHIYYESGSYRVKLRCKMYGCPEHISDTLIMVKDADVQLPNIFTPNNDGMNDCFKVKVPQNCQHFQAQIFSRSGHLVYNWKDKDYCWDGFDLSGKKVTSGTYFYIISGVDSQKKAFEYKSFLRINP